MEVDINNIRVNDWFWVQFQKTFTSFRFKGLPEDVHFTLAYNETSPELNLHLTRNTGSPTDKPKIEIIRMNKKELERMAPYAYLNFLNLSLKPFNLKKLIKKSKKKAIKFIPIETLETGKCAVDLQNHLFDGFKPLARVQKKRRLKIEGAIEDKAMELIASDTMIGNMKRATLNFKYHHFKNAKGGIFRIKGKTKALLRVQDRWFEYSNNAKPLDLVTAVVGRECALYLKRYVRESIVRIRKASNFDETRKWSNPLFLIANPNLPDEYFEKGYKSPSSANE
jgi:hypothetical protein